MENHLLIKQKQLISICLEKTDMAISIWDEKFIIRSVSEDNYDLRIALQKILPYFYNNELPKMWKF